MSENTNNEKEVSAKLIDNEAVVPEAISEDVKETVSELIEKDEEASKVEEKKIEKVDDVKLEDLEDLSDAKELDVKPENSKDAIVIPKPMAKPGLGVVGNGAMGSTTFTASKKKESAPKAKAEVEKVAVHSTRNVSWTGVGKVYNGYNIVTKEAAEKWLTRDHVRLATPEEVAQEFGL